MPAYNAAHYIRSAVASVQAQTFSGWELVVVDDGSQDETSAIVEEISATDARVQLVRQQNSGLPGAARNTALKRARGQYIAFLDADDLFAPEKLQVLVEVSERNPNCGLIFHDFSTISSAGDLLVAGVLGNKEFLASPLVGSQTLGDRVHELGSSVPAFLVSQYVAIWTGAVLLCRSALPSEELFFRTDVTIGEDLDLWLRILRGSRALFVESPLSSYRKHGESITNQRDRFLSDTVTVIEDHCDWITQSSGGEARDLVRGRLRRLASHLAYSKLKAGDRDSARYWYKRSITRYGDIAATKGWLRTYLP